MKEYLHLLETLIEKAPQESFTNPDGEVLDKEIFHVVFPKGEVVNLAQLREGCKAQLVGRDTEVEEWIEHQKTNGGATDDVKVFGCENSDAVLHIIFITEDDNEAK